MNDAADATLPARAYGTYNIIANILSCVSGTGEISCATGTCSWRDSLRLCGNYCALYIQSHHPVPRYSEKYRDLEFRALPCAMKPGIQRTYLYEASSSLSQR